MKNFTFDADKWVPVPCKFVPTFQYFITNKCNTKCEGCFMKKRIGNQQVTFDQYKENVYKYISDVDKVILIGGEPTLHPDIETMIRFNADKGLRTTVYTNGHNLKALKDVKNYCTIRVSVDGIYSGAKPLKNFQYKDLSDYEAELVFMTRLSNHREILPAAYMAESMGFSKFFLSSMVDIHETGNYWEAALSCLDNHQYFKVAQNFINKYNGNLDEIQVTMRGHIDITGGDWKTCRFLNLFPNGDKIICPYDIARDTIHEGEFNFCERKCQKHSRCLLQKLILKRRIKDE